MTKPATKRRVDLEAKSLYAGVAAEVASLLEQIGELTAKHVISTIDEPRLFEKAEEMAGVRNQLVTIVARLGGQSEDEVRLALGAERFDR